MATYTSRIQATKPASSEQVDVTVLNNNFDLFDSAVGATVAASSSRPASAFSGRLFYATDSDKLYVNEAVSASTVASWTDLSGGAAATSSTLVKKTSSTGRISTTTVTSDPHLALSIAAAAVYKLETHLVVNGAAAGDVKTNWLLSGFSLSTERLCRGPSTTVTDSQDGNMRSSTHGWTTEVGYGVDGTRDSYITEHALIDNSGGGAGTMTLRWAQNSSTATSTVITSASWALLERLS